MNTKCIADTIRGLSIDGVQAANSGHPGMPMGMADVASVLWTQFLNVQPENPGWANRDRFVLSAGHGSMLIYSLLHLAGYDLSLEELKRFRQWESKTPGHPEFGRTAGVETTTGPLGQGCGNAVGMALAEAMLASRFNTENCKLIDHFTYVICSDGEMMEGVSHEVFALAGHLKLGKLIVFYDDNHITIEGRTDLAYSDDVRKRFESYHWQVLEIDGHDHGAIAGATEAAQQQTDQPTLVICKTTIGFGSPNKADTPSCHGAPLGEEEIIRTKENLGMPGDQAFYIPDEVKAAFEERKAEGIRKEAAWNETYAAYREAHPDKAREWDTFQGMVLPEDLAAAISDFKPGGSIATRKASGSILQELAEALPFLVGGSADLAPSTNTLLNEYGDIAAGAYEGRNFHFGVRELGMAAILNGLQLHGGLRVFGSTFLVFADFARPALRLGALMNQPVIHVFTHDSFFVGEDGPTHQPIETLMSLRIIPNLTVIRPADAQETKFAWLAALANKTGPTALLLTRQNLPIYDRGEVADAAGVSKGAYVFWENHSEPEIILIASGSEVEQAYEGGKKLADEGVSVRVVSMPSWELFEAQSSEYRISVLPPQCTKRVAIEAGCTHGWERYTGDQGLIIGRNTFGASAPAEVLAEQFGFTVENVVKTAKTLL